MIKSAKHLPTLKSYVTKRSSLQQQGRATPGEKVLGKLFPNRGAGFPGGWDSDHIKQVNHLVDWVYVAVHTICMKVASITPNMAWVSDANRPSPKTKRADQRGLLNASGQGFGGSSHIESTVAKRPESGLWRSPPGILTSGSWHDYSVKVPMDSMLGSGGSSAFLTMGEYRSKALSVVKPHEELEPIETGHLLRRLVDSPNPTDTSFDFRYERTMFLLLCGAAYEWVIPNAFGRPCERWVIPSHWVWPRTGGGQVVDADHPDADRLIQYYEVRPWGGMGSAGILKLPPDQVIMHRFKSPVNKLLGYSKLWALSRWIDVEESISNSRFAQMSNQARPEFWVEMPASFNDPDDSMIARWEAKIAQKHQGEFNLHRPLFMPAGAKAQVLSFSPEEMAYFNSEEQITNFILAGFGLSRSSVGLVTDMTFGSVLASLMGDCERCYNTLLTMEGQTETKHLASRFDEEVPAWSQGAGGAHGGSGGWRRCRLWYDNCTPADPAQVNADIAVDLQGHAMTPNMLLALRGRPPYKLGGDNPLVQGPGGLMPLPINVEEKGDDITDLVRRYSESMAADKDVTRLATNEATEDVPKEPSDGQGQSGGGGAVRGGDDAGVAGDALAEIADGPKVDKPNGKPAKSIRKSTADAAVRDLSQFLNNLPDEFKDGLYVWVNIGPPKLVIVDLMDWWAQDVRQGAAEWEAKIKRAASMWAGDEQRVVMRNEGGKPGSEWQQVFPDPYGKPSKSLVMKARKINDAGENSRLLAIWIEARGRRRNEPALHPDRDNPYHPGNEYDAWKAGLSQKPFPFTYGPAKRLRTKSITTDISPTFYDECKDLARQVLKDLEEATP